VTISDLEAFAWRLTVPYTIAKPTMKWFRPSWRLKLRGPKGATPSKFLAVDDTEKKSEDEGPVLVVPTRDSDNYRKALSRASFPATKPLEREIDKSWLCTTQARGKLFFESLAPAH